MINDPKVTIILCVLNKEETVKSCIESVLSLNYSSAPEIIVIDGFSKDKSFEILENYKREGIQLFQVSGGYSSQLNFGIKKARGQLIALTDADCIVDENWLKELTKGFKEKGVIATAGYCGTPRTANLLQNVIGIELENRFKRFPRYLQRAPTMNFCVKSEIAKKLLFDEKIKVGVETDFCYRLTKMGKIAYMPKAVVWHSHRATWRSYFKQQLNTARGAFWVYVKHPQKLTGDHISTPTMMLQIILAGLSLLLLFLALVESRLFYLALIVFLTFLATVFYEILEIKPKLEYMLPLVLLYFVRNIAFVAGSIESSVLFLLKRRAKQNFRL